MLPIRLRLTAQYTIMFTAAALLLCSTSWWMLRHSIQATVAQELQERVDDVSAQLHQMGASPDPVQMQLRFDAIYHYRDDGKWLQIRDRQGRWIYRSSRMLLLQAPLAPPDALTKGSTVAEFTQGARHIHTLTSLVMVDGRAYSVQTGVAMNKSETLLHHFGLGLLLLTPAVLLAAIFAGHMMSRQALAPVVLIAHQARHISDKNLNQRLPVSPANDELTHLAVTLNTMLGRIDTGFRSVRDFTANASHELRTPLARLHTEIEIALLRPRSGDEYRDTLEQLQSAVIDMTGLLENLLALARAEAGSDLLRLAPVDLHVLVQTVFEEWAPIASRLSIQLRNSVRSAAAGPAGASLVLGDRLMLLRLLRIWLDNACKFTPPGGTITIIVEDEGEQVILALDDSGVGIAAEEQGRIFERFYRCQGDTAVHRTGAGLGLSLAAWIAEQHGTSIALESTPGRGSRFQLALSRCKDVSYEHKSRQVSTLTQ